MPLEGTVTPQPSPFGTVCSPCCNSRLVLLLPVLFCWALLCRREMLAAERV